MNKITKIWVLWLALFALTTSLFTKADVEKEVKLILNQWENTCTMDSYDFGDKNVWNAAVNLQPISHPLTCEFLKTSAHTVNIQLTDLANGSISSIAKGNFSFAVSGATHVWWIADLVATGNTFASGHTIYTKAVNKVWSWSTTLTLSWTVPQFTPAWTYTGTLKLQVQANQ